MDDATRSIMKKLIDNGHEAYIVGGAVRDIILGKKPKDFDITTSANPKEVMTIFKDYSLKLNGLRFGTVGILMPDKTIEVTSYRKDGDYYDNRRPKKVTFTKDVTEDLKRRDFYINAILMDIDGKILDPLGGMQDIKDKKIRAIGNPYHRFKEDALRILRAIRFSGQLGFLVEEETKAAIKELAANLDHISLERKIDELLKTIIAPHPYVLEEYRNIFNRFISYDAVTASLYNTDDMVLRLALLFIGHSPEIDKLGLDKKEAKEIKTYISYSDPKEEELPSIFSSVTDIEHYIKFVHLYKGIDLRPHYFLIKDYIVTSDTLAIKTSDLMSLGYKDKSLGDIKRQLVDLIHKKVIRNDYQDIMSYLLKGMV